MKHQSNASLIWNEIAEKLTLSQYEKCMFKDYWNKIKIVKKVSKDKKVLDLCEKLSTELLK